VQFQDTTVSNLPTRGIGVGASYYGDDRDVLFLDNRPLALRRADLGRHANLHTIGGNVVHLEPLGPGNLDAMAYGMAQVGSWQSQDQSSYARGQSVISANFSGTPADYGFVEMIVSF